MNETVQSTFACSLFANFRCFSLKPSKKNVLGYDLAVVLPFVSISLFQLRTLCAF